MSLRALHGIGSAVTLLGVGLVLHACAGRAPETVDPRRAANAGAVLDELAQRTLDAPFEPRVPGFAALTAEGQLLFLDARGGERFRSASGAAGLQVAGEAVVEVLPDEVSLRAWPSGRALGRVARESSTRFVGASVEGTRIAFIEASAARRAQVSLGTLGPAGLTIGHQLPADGDLGAPLLRAGLVLIPHDGHELLIVDAESGSEQARRRSRDDTIRWARVDGGRVYFGGRRVYALRPGLADATSADAVLDPDVALVPAPPFDALLEPAATTDADPADAGPDGLTSPPRPAPVHWARVPLEPSSEPRSDRAYVITRGHVFAFDGDGAFRFVHALRGPPLASLATEDGLTLLHADGTVEGLHPDDGSQRFQQSVGPLRSALAVQPTGASPRTEPPRATPPPAASLLSVLLAHDTRAVPDQVYAAHLMTTVEESVAAELLNIYVDRRTEPPVRDAIAMTLRARANDTDALVRALADHHDFLADGGERAPPPLHAILPALARAERSDAYAALLGHLNDPATPVEALPLVIDQLVRWGGAEALAPLLDFVRRYRADSTFAVDVSPLAHAARAVDGLGGARERADLSALLAREGTHPALSEAVARAAQSRAAREVVASDAAPAPPSVESESGPLPRLASSESVEAHALEQLDQLSPCLDAARAAQPSLRTVRVRLVLERGGRVALVSVLPGGALERCIADAATTMRWPRITSARQQVGFTLRLTPDAPTTRPRSAPAWWAASAERAPRGVAVQPGLPWWASPDTPAADAAEDEREWWQPASGDESSRPIDRWWRPTADAP